jgi:molybdenum cofactor cytidylyltransferase
MIAGIVLAAGRSQRMGEPKAFLRLEGRSFLERAVVALQQGGCGDVLVVAGPREDDTARRIAESALALGARAAVNPAAGSEQIDSLRLALAAMRDDAVAALVVPVDVPEVAAATVHALCEAFRRTGGPIVLPMHEGRHGHPVLFARAVWPELLEGELAEGARTVIHAHAAELVEVAVAALPLDVDTPDDFRRLAEGG